jgi:hypothetical protein
MVDSILPTMRRSAVWPRSTRFLNGPSSMRVDLEAPLIHPAAQQLNANLPQQAICAAADGKEPSWLRPDHLADWRGLVTALGRLCPEEYCDAVSAAWWLPFGWRTQV